MRHGFLGSLACPRPSHSIPESTNRILVGRFLKFLSYFTLSQGSNPSSEDGLEVNLNRHLSTLGHRRGLQLHPDLRSPFPFSLNLLPADFLKPWVLPRFYILCLAYTTRRTKMETTATFSNHSPFAGNKRYQSPLSPNDHSDESAITRS